MQATLKVSSKKNYRCRSCGHNFMGVGVIVTCTRCKSRNVRRVK